jgi:hypothetical protein
MNYYGTVDEANAYFSTRLHESAWSDASQDDQPKALLAATKLIDGLNFKGQKHAVWQLMQQARGPLWKHPTGAQIREANASQVLEFPRDSDTVVPDDICVACFEIAHSLLDGKDPEAELEALGISQQQFGPVQVSFSRHQPPLEHIANGIPSMLAWRLLRPFLRLDSEVHISRVS